MRNRVIVVGGGASGFFGAIACAEVFPDAQVLILEKSSQVLQKVRISGGGRCNVTHACFDARELTRSYPRGEKELIGPYHQFRSADTVQWFEAHGVKLKTEGDGRMFPTTDSSETIVQCLVEAARRVGVEVLLNRAVNSATRTAAGGFLVEDQECERLSLASGGCRTATQGGLAVGLGHTLVPPVPSLFTFHVDLPWVRELAGVTLPEVELALADTRLKTRGSLLFTHWGMSGPAVLRLSAWGARSLHERNYKFPLRVAWVPQLDWEVLQRHARGNGAKLVANASIPPLPLRLWHALLKVAAVADGKRWNNLSRVEQERLFKTLTDTELPVTGKSLNKDEFVTCGGVSLPEVNFKTMESKICPGLHFGEVLDIDGITGGFNFQAAWTTGWIAGRNIGQALADASKQRGKLLDL